MSQYPIYAVEIWRQNEKNGPWELIKNIEPLNEDPSITSKELRKENK